MYPAAMSLRCSCGKPVHFASVDAATETARCPWCGAVFSAAGRLAETHGAPALASTRDAPALAAAPAPHAIPDTFTEEKLARPARAPTYRESARPDGGKRWTYRWYRWRAIPGIVVWAAMTFGMRGLGFSEGPLFWVFLLSGGGAIYSAIAHLFNHSTIALDRAGLTVRSGPIPWRWITRRRDELRGFETRAQGGKGLNPTFEVRILRRTGSARRLLGDMSVDEANYLASQLNEALQRDGGG
jgi:hypothetical protein